MKTEKLSQELISIGNFSELTGKADEFIEINKELFLQKLLSLALIEKMSIAHELVQIVADSGVVFDAVLTNITSLYELELLAEHFFDQLDKTTFLEKLTSQYTYFSAHQEFIALKQKLIKKFVNTEADIAAALEVATGLKNLQLLSQFLKKIDKDLFLSRVLIAHASTSEERTVKTEFIEQTIKDGASINNALKKAGLSLNNLQFLAQNYFEKIEKDLFLNKVLSTYASTEEEKQTQRELFVKALDAGATITQLKVSPHSSAFIVPLLLEHKDKIINKHSAKAILNALLEFVSSQDAVDPEIEEIAIAMITEYNIPVPEAAMDLPFGSLQKIYAITTILPKL